MTNHARKDIADITVAFEQAQSRGKRSALATLVLVVGSSYHRPGSRLLITEDGHLTGTISGGPLEGEILRSAFLSIEEGQNRLIRYDATDEMVANFGHEYGCNSIIYILFEPIHEEDVCNPIQLMRLHSYKREDAVLVTLFSLKREGQLGTRLLYRKWDQLGILPVNIHEAIRWDMESVLQNKCSSFRLYEEEDQHFDVFMEFLSPSLALIIAGAGNEARPLVDFGRIMGWHITVIDERPSHATPDRFENANQVIVARADELVKHFQMDYRTVFLLMTHNYSSDFNLLKKLVLMGCSYIGISGSIERYERLLKDLRKEEGAIRKNMPGCIFVPLGQKTGAETAEQIAASVVSEIEAAIQSQWINSEKRSPSKRPN